MHQFVNTRQLTISPSLNSHIHNIASQATSRPPRNLLGPRTGQAGQAAVLQICTGYWHQVVCAIEKMIVQQFLKGLRTSNGCRRISVWLHAKMKWDPCVEPCVTNALLFVSAPFPQAHYAWVRNSEEKTFSA